MASWLDYIAVGDRIHLRDYNDMDNASYYDVTQIIISSTSPPTNAVVLNMTWIGSTVGGAPPVQIGSPCIISHTIRGATGPTGNDGQIGATKVVASSLTFAKYLTGDPDLWKVNSVKWFGATNVTSTINNVAYLWITSGGVNAVPRFVFFNPPDVAAGHHPFTREPSTTAPHHVSGKMINITQTPVSMHQATGYLAPYKGRIIGYSVNSLTPWASGINMGRNLQSVPVFVGRAFPQQGANGYYNLELTGNLQSEPNPTSTGPRPVGGYENFLPQGGAWPNPQPSTSWEIAFDAGDYLVSGLTPTWAAYTNSPQHTALPIGYTSGQPSIYFNPPVNVTMHVIFDI